MTKERLYYKSTCGMTRGYVYARLEDNVYYINYRQLLRIGARLVHFCTDREVIYKKDKSTPWWDYEQLQEEITGEN